MKQIDDEKMKSLLEVAHELRNKEFKPPFSWSDRSKVWHREKIVRAVLGMTNTKYGGDIVVGVEEKISKRGKKISLKGLTEKQLESFDHYDGIKAFIDSFSYSPIYFEPSWGQLDNKKYVVFTVSEFDEQPAICRKDGQNNSDILRKDDIYARSKKGQPSTIRATELELREMIRMAVDKEKAQLKKRGYRKIGELSTDEYYKKQVEDLE